MKINLIGRSNHTGIGSHFGGFHRALVRCRPDIETTITDPWDPATVEHAVTQTQPTDVNISFIGGDLGCFQGRWIQWIPFESTRIPDVLRPCLHQCHEIWTMTRWGHDVLIDNGFGTDKIRVVPQGIDIFDCPAPKPTSTMNFLFVGKYEKRKGLTETLQAWSRTLSRDPACALIIKTHEALPGTRDHKTLLDDLTRRGIENFQMLWGVMSDRELLDLYRRADIFILPSRGEGWGRPLMEAAAMDLPIITTRWSAHGEWLSDIENSVIWVDHDLEDIDDQNFRTCYPDQDHWGRWARPSVDHLAGILDDVKSRLPDLRTRAAINGQRIRQQYHWDRIVDRAMEVLGL